MSQNFRPADAAAIAGPGWLVERRQAAASRFAGLALPDDQLEEWRYSRIGELDLDAYAPVPADADRSVDGTAAALAALVDDPAAVVVIRNGLIADDDLAGELAARGVFVGRLADTEGAERRALLGAAVADGDAFTVLNEAFGVEPLLIDVPAGVTVERPILIASTVDADGVAVFPRIVVRAGADSEVRIVEWATSADVDAFVAPVVEIHCGPAARVHHLGVQDLGPRVTQIATNASVVEGSGTVELAHAAIGGGYARARFDCRLVGRGATGNLSALYFGSDDQMIDLRTFQDHLAADTTSNLLFKGAVDDRSRAVYSGLIRISRDGRGSNANQSNHIVKLSPEAWAESVPNLEIEQNDVRCSHASTVGPIDADQRFYLESRGIPPEVAERLVVAGFFEEVIERFGSTPGVAAAVRSRVASLLHAPGADAPAGGAAAVAGGVAS